MRIICSAVAVGVLVVASASVAISAGAADSAGSVTVVATNLNNPRNLWSMSDGSIYIAESGKAGPKCLSKDTCLGFSSSVTRWSPGKRQRVVTNLLSAGGKDGTFTTGADGVAVDQGGTIYIAMTGPPECKTPPNLPARARAQLGRLLRVRGGKIEAVADLNGLECKNNYDGTDRNSNPYAVLALGGDHEVVVDAGANALFDVRGKKTTLLATFPTTGGAQSVPTSIALGPDGAYYVGEFTGESKGKAKAGIARVWKVVPGKKPVVYRRGFSSITGVAVAKDGTLYVTEFTINPASEREARGAVIKVAPDGKRTRLGLGQLFFPAGAALGPDGSLFVSNWSILPGSPAKGGPFKGKTGQLVRIKP